VKRPRHLPYCERSVSPEAKHLLLRWLSLAWSIAAWSGLIVSIILFLLAAAQLVFRDLRFFNADSGDLLASLAFFAIIGGLCVWLIIYGRRFFERFKTEADP
jgi:H+/Cl- antiporter ClcA